MRVTKTSLANQIRRITRRLCKVFSLYSQSQMPGTRYRVEDNSGSRNVSQLYTPKEMEAWLEGFEKALEELGFMAQDETNARARNNDFYKQQIDDCSGPMIGALFCPCYKCKEIVEERRRIRKIE